MTYRPTRVAAPERSLTARRESALAALGAVIVAAVMKAPALFGLGRTIPKDLADPLYQSWQLAWGAHALQTSPLSPWDANILWPLPMSFAFNDSLYGYAPLSVLFGSGATAALVRYSVVFVLAYALAAAASYLLARQLGCRPVAAGVAAGIYAFAPWHLSQDGHLNVLSNGAVPLCLALLARGHGIGVRGDGGPTRPWCALAGWVVAAWQLTMTLVVGLQLTYLLGALVTGATILLILGCWRPFVGTGRALLIADLVGLVIFVAVAAALAQPYYTVAAAHPQVVRTVNDLNYYSPPLLGFLIAPAESTVWGALHADARAELRWPVEQAMSVGAVAVFLATYGVVAGVWSRWRRVSLAVSAGVLLLVAAGTAVARGRVFLLLFDYAPGWRSVRTPGRLVILVALGVALLAANGVEALCRSARRPRLTGLALIGLVLLEGHGALPAPRVPPPSPGLAIASKPVLVLPSDDTLDFQTMWASTDGFPLIVNGVTAFAPQVLGEMRRHSVGFPDAESVAFLRQAGVRSVVLRPALSSRTPWAGAENRPIEGLGLRVRTAGNDLVYDLTPGRA